MRLDSEGGGVVIAACLAEDVVVVLMRLVVVVVLKELSFSPGGHPVLVFLFASLFTEMAAELGSARYIDHRE